MKIAHFLSAHQLRAVEPQKRSNSPVMDTYNQAQRNSDVKRIARQAFDKADGGQAPSKTHQRARALLLQALKQAFSEKGLQTTKPNTEREIRHILRKVKVVADYKAAKIIKKYLRALAEAGIMKQIPRKEISFDVGTQTNYLIDREKQGLISGRSNSTLDRGTTANLALIRTPDRVILRHGKVEQAGDYKVIARLAAGQSQPHPAGLKPQIARYDQKTPGGVGYLTAGFFRGMADWLTGGRYGFSKNSEAMAAKTERQAVQGYNQSREKREPEIKSWSFTANMLASTFKNGFTRGLLGGLRPSGAERAINQAPMQDKTIRALIEIKRLSGQDVTKLSAAYNENQEGTLKQDPLISRVLAGQDIVNSMKNMSLLNPEASALRDAMVALHSGKLSRNAEMALHTFIDPQLGITSDIGCKSGLDRTGHLTFVTLAGEALRRKYGTARTLRFLIDFDQTKSGQMLEDYRLAYHQATMDIGLPATKSSYLVAGLKWSKRGSLGENQLPKAYIPRQITLKDGGKKLELIDSKGEFTEVGEAIYKGLSNNRGT